MSRAAHYYFAFLSFLYLFISLKYYIWNASSARLHFWLQKKKITCQNVSSRGGGGGGRGWGGLMGTDARTCLVFGNNILLAEGFLSYVLDKKRRKKKKKKKKKKNIFQQSFEFPTLNDNLTLRTVRKEVDLYIFFFTHQYQDG